MTMINNDRKVYIRKKNSQKRMNILSESFNDLVETIRGEVSALSSEFTINDAVFLSLSSGESNITVNNETSMPLQQLYTGMKNVAGAIDGGPEVMGAVEGLSKLGASAYSFLTSWGTGENVKINPWFKDLKGWNGTSLGIGGLNFDFAMGQFGLWNAEEEVYKPSIALAALSLPRSQAFLTANGPFLSSASLYANFTKYIGTKISSSDDISLSSILNNENSGYLEVQFGKSFSLDYCIITTANVSFSNETDQNGFPIRARVTLNLQGTVPPALNVSGNTPIALRFGGIK